VAEEFARRGWSVVAASRNRRELGAVVETIAGAGGRAHAFVADVRESAQVERLVAFAGKHLPALDAVFHTAGDWVFKPVEKTSLREWQATLDANLTSVFLLAKAAVPALKKSGGVFVPIISIAGKKAFPNCGAYCASKFGLRGFVEVLREELRPRVRVLGVYPGAVDTAFWNKAGKGWNRSRMMKPAELAVLLADAVERPGRGMVEDLTVMPVWGEL
jgi:NAD(P)-dependent dehydrogenase (short-subunit alcohol dehydrogenase family)